MDLRRFRLGRALAAAGISVAAALLTLSPTAVLAGGNGGGGGLSPSQAAALGAYKAAHDTDPHVNESFSSSSTSSLSGGSATASFSSASIATGLPVNYLVGKNQQPQQTSYWCGPAANSEAIGLWGYSYSQTWMANTMHTTSSGGTAWSGVNAAVPSSFLTGHPMRDTLDYLVKLNTNWDPGYAVVAVPYTPTSTDVNNYIARMTLDIWALEPVVADAWEVAGYAHLVGHPVNLTIFHWFTIIGYENNGSLTSYEDSATSVWSTVPAYTMNFNSSTLVTIIGGRGYIY